MIRDEHKDSYSGQEVWFGHQLPIMEEAGGDSLIAEIGNVSWPLRN